MIIFTISIIPLMFTIILILINTLLSLKIFQDREKPSPYECGFNPLTSPHLPFSIQFYLVAVIFLIFDIEIIFMLPFTPSLTMNYYLFYWMQSFLMIYICLVIGLIYEWNEQSIIWLK
uniref:NADH-ubiquinone oxidoreductase chain 3 n=1 Tax=Vespa magnifica TaxID=202807 RepID=A0A6M8NYJ0_VESMG|nr:NADH dehydrogenase subunit 3 [Vespa magnifica]QKG04160.1 NADH dehydrogenase subunit 3 [Vespa magnifica]UQW19832.1 NADH dehydrogenase subunit 3 [Vespa magnifica]WHL55433.1 NADH dehydrogenase subunit 3 [Vespa magnifica]